jgi:acyl-CoA synthetase (AMP-forming)/AMP-acid ligase II
MGELRRPQSYVPLEIADGVRSSARRTPTKIALQEGARKLSFADLVARADRISSGVLNGLGLRPGQHAAIFAPNCLEFIEISLGLASAGVAPAMVNSRSTSAELAQIANDSEARVLFVHRSLEEVARSADLDPVERIIVIGGDYEDWLAQARPARPSVSPEEWDTFCIPYTAGTTGRPKGVLLPHRSRTLTFFAMGVEYGCFTAEDRALAIAPLFHGAGFAFALAPIFFGGYCAIVPKFDPELVVGMLVEHRITNTFMVPTHFAALFGLGQDTLARHNTSALRTLISNAAPLSQATKERIVAHFGEDVLFEIYGSTEAGIVSSLHPADQLRKEQCVGVPFPCTSVKILDEDGDEVPPGTVGELYSRSPFLFSGYWKQPDETAACFRDGFFSAGDLARQDEEGYIYLVDRKKDMIVSGGVNIYPREIEEVLVRHPAVGEVAVFGVPDDYWGEAVRAAVVLHPGESASEKELLDFCKESISHYKRPKAIDFLVNLPKNATGKVLRRDLREPFWSGRERRIS